MRWRATAARPSKEEGDEEFVEDYLSKADPSILNFLIASGDDVTSKQLRDDLMVGQRPPPARSDSPSPFVSLTACVSCCVMCSDHSMCRYSCV